VVDDVQFSFNIKTLANLDDHRRRAHEGKTTSVDLKDKTGEQVKLCSLKHQKK